jgi:hypothetical protein
VKNGKQGHSMSIKPQNKLLDDSNTQREDTSFDAYLKAQEPVSLKNRCRIYFALWLMPLLLLSVQLTFDKYRGGGISVGVLIVSVPVMILELLMISPYFPFGLLIFLSRVCSIGTGGLSEDTMLFVGWLFYALHGVLLLSCGRKKWFFLLLALFVAVLLMNTKGCSIGLNGLGNIH